MHYATSFKVVFDFLFSVLLIILLLPVSFVIAVILWFHKVPVFFIQRRIGKKEEVFYVFKFTSMKLGEVGVQENERQFFFGKILRRTGLDEIPQLFNVVRGEMSLVGPRPLLPEYLSKFTKEQSRRHEVKPGITGLAQVKGRTSLTWKEQLRLDVEYVDNQSFIEDFIILLKTPFVMFRPVKTRERLDV